MEVTTAPCQGMASKSELATETSRHRGSKPQPTSHRMESPELQCIGSQAHGQQVQQALTRRQREHDKSEDLRRALERRLRLRRLNRDPALSHDRCTFWLLQIYAWSPDLEHEPCPNPLLPLVLSFRVVLALQWDFEFVLLHEAMSSAIDSLQWVVTSCDALQVLHRVHASAAGRGCPDAADGGAGGPNLRSECRGARWGAHRCCMGL